MSYRNNVKEKQKQLQRRLSAHAFCIYSTRVICKAQYKVQTTGNTLHVHSQVRVSQLWLLI